MNVFEYIAFLILGFLIGASIGYLDIFNVSKFLSFLIKKKGNQNDTDY